MSIEGRIDPAIKLDEFRDTESLLGLIQGYEEKKLPLIFLEGKVEAWEFIKTALLSLRSSNVSAMLLLQKSDQTLVYAETVKVIENLRGWDQLFLQNVVLLCDSWIPAKFRSALATEARMELKWFREWFAASTDSRVAKYPGLPWRSYIRKTIHENFLFAEQLIHIRPGADSEKGTDEIIQSFLQKKKKAINTFPKRWMKFQ